MNDAPHAPTLAELADIASEPIFTPKTHADLLADLLTLQGQMLRRRRLLRYELQLVEDRLEELCGQLNALRGAGVAQ